MPSNPFKSYFGSYGDFFRPKPKSPFNFLQDYVPEPGPKGTDTSSPEPSFQGRDAVSYMDEMKNVFMRERPAESAYRQHIQNMPVDTGPSGWRKLGGALVTAASAMGGDPNAVNYGIGVMRAPYENKMRDWAMRGEGMHEAAELEDRSRMRDVQGLNAIGTAERFGQSQDLRERREERLATSAEFRQELATNAQFARQEMDKWRRENGDKRFDADEAWRKRQGEFRERGLDQGDERIKVSRDVAQTGRMNAETGRKRANIFDWATQNRIENMWGKGSEAGDTYTPGSAMNQRRAEEDATIKLVRTNPKFAKFVDENGNIRSEIGGGFMQNATPVSSDPDWPAFSAALEAEKRKILTKPGKGKSAPKRATTPKAKDEEYDWVPGKGLVRRN